MNRVKQSGCIRLDERFAGPLHAGIVSTRRVRVESHVMIPAAHRAEKWLIPVRNGRIGNVIGGPTDNVGLDAVHKRLRIVTCRTNTVISRGVNRIGPGRMDCPAGHGIVPGSVEGDLSRTYHGAGPSLRLADIVRVGEIAAAECRDASGVTAKSL